MSDFPIVRAIHLNVFIEELRAIGAPVDRGLERAGLPADIEVKPDAYLCVPRVLRFVEETAGAEAAMDLGFLAAQRYTLDNVRPEFKTAILSAPSGFGRICAFRRLAGREDSALVCGLAKEGSCVRIWCDLAAFPTSPALAYSEWLQLQGLVSTIRDLAGPGWTPSEMTFISRRPPSELARATYGNTRILVGQPHTSLLVPIGVLARPCPGGPPPSEDWPEADAPTWQFAEALCAAVASYLGERTVDLPFAAAMAGTSPRSLQRRLERDGLTWREIVDRARYALACRLLVDDQLKVIDVAYSAGYENPQHFSRAFRRISGLSPRAYRSQLRSSAFGPVPRGAPPAKRRAPRDLPAQRRRTMAPEATSRR